MAQKVGLMRGAPVSDEVSSEERGSDSGIPVGVGATPPPSTRLAEAWNVIRMIALIALMLLLAGVVARALQLLMGLLGFTLG